MSIIREQFYKNKISWINSSKAGISLDEYNEPIPWMTYNFIDFLKKNLLKENKIFEFGCGSSTVFFAKHCATVQSIETRSSWLEFVKSLISKYNLHNTNISLKEDALTNDEYENYPASFNFKFDYIVIDSIKRYNCALIAPSALAKNGIIILDDSHIRHRKKIFDYFESINFKKQNFIGIAPGQVTLKNTTIFWR